KVGLEYICPPESDAVADARLGKVLLAFGNARRVEIDADRFLCLEVAHGCDRDAAVAGAEIVVNVVGADLSELKHALDEVVRRRDVDYIETRPRIRRGVLCRRGECK